MPHLIAVLENNMLIHRLLDDTDGVLSIKELPLPNSTDRRGFSYNFYDYVVHPGNPPPANNIVYFVEECSYSEIPGEQPNKRKLFIDCSKPVNSLNGVHYWYVGSFEDTDINHAGCLPFYPSTNDANSSIVSYYRELLHIKAGFMLSQQAAFAEQRAAHAEHSAAYIQARAIQAEQHAAWLAQMAEQERQQKLALASENEKLQETVKNLETKKPLIISTGSFYGSAPSTTSSASTAASNSTSDLSPYSTFFKRLDDQEAKVSDIDATRNILDNIQTTANNSMTQILADKEVVAQLRKHKNKKPQKIKTPIVVKVATTALNKFGTGINIDPNIAANLSESAVIQEAMLDFAKNPQSFTPKKINEVTQALVKEQKVEIKNSAVIANTAEQKQYLNDFYRMLKDKGQKIPAPLTALKNIMPDIAVTSLSAEEKIKLAAGVFVCFLLTGYLQNAMPKIKQHEQILCILAGTILYVAYEAAVARINVGRNTSKRR